MISSSGGVRRIPSVTVPALVMIFMTWMLSQRRCQLSGELLYDFVVPMVGLIRRVNSAPSAFLVLLIAFLPSLGGAEGVPRSGAASVQHLSVLANVRVSRLRQFLSFAAAIVWL